MVKADIARLIEPAIEQLGYEMSDFELKIGGRDGIVRVFIDKPEGVDLEDCEAVSRQVSSILDVEDPLPGHYTLEVSSPGLDRRLTKPEHFQRFMGEIVRIRLRFPVDGRRNFRGTLTKADDDQIVVDVDGQMHSLKIATIEMARLVPVE